MNMTEDFFIPVRGGDSGTSIESLPGLEYNALDDVEYLKNKVLAALKIPKAFLGFDEAMGGKATLAAEDVRFSKTIERVQKAFVSELYHIAYVHLITQGFKDEEIAGYSIELTNPSTIVEQEKISLWQEKINLVRDMKETKLFSEVWIYKNIINLTEEDVKDMKKEVIEDTKKLFRLNQIENEGNDPFVTKQTFGTPHDLAVMQQRAHYDAEKSNEKMLDFGENNFKMDYSPHVDDEIPSKSGGYHEDPQDDYGEQNHVRGRDPLGADGATAPIRRDTQRRPVFKNGSPLSLDSLEVVKKRVGIKQLNDYLETQRNKSKKVITESLLDADEKKDEIAESNDGTLLDEKNILDI
jgi:hypothetical protein